MEMLMMSLVNKTLDVLRQESSWGMKLWIHLKRLPRSTSISTFYFISEPFFEAVLMTRHTTLCSL